VGPRAVHSGPGMEPAPPPYLASLRRLITDGRPWVLFEHGTVVVLPDATGPTDLADRARLALRHDAEQRAGSAAGDPAVRRYGDAGWVVASSDPNVFTFVPEHTIGDGATDVTVGMAGRTAHDAGASGGRVVYVEA